MNGTKSFFLLTLSTLLLASCGGGNEGISSSSEEEQVTSSTPKEDESSENSVFPLPDYSLGTSGSHDGVYTLRFDTRGGGHIDPITVKKGELATRPSDPVKAGETFVNWYLDLSFALPYDWDKPVDGDFFLYAGYESDLAFSSSSSQTQGEDSSTATNPVLPEGPYGPEGAHTNSYALVGSGSSFIEDWTVTGGLKLYNNPGNPMDKGCLFNVSFAEGDLFKVSDGVNWFGYEKVESNPFVDSHFKQESSASTNILCTSACLIDIYVNQFGNLWIAEHLPY